MVVDSNNSLRENKCVTVFAFLVFLALATFSDVNKIFPSSWLILYLKTVSSFWKWSSKWLNICSPFLYIPLKWSSFMDDQAVKLSGRASDCLFIYFYWPWGISYMEAACIWTVWLTVLKWGRRKGKERKLIKELFEVDLNRDLEGTTECNTNNTRVSSPEIRRCFGIIFVWMLQCF